MLNEKYKKEQSKITWLSIRLPVNITSIDLDPMLKIAVTDLCSKKFSSESLVLLMETGTKLKMDYLNRVSTQYIYTQTLKILYIITSNTINSLSAGSNEYH